MKYPCQQYEGEFVSTPALKIIGKRRSLILAQKIEKSVSENLTDLADSMPKRCLAVIKAKGGPTKY